MKKSCSHLIHRSSLWWSRCFSRVFLFLVFQERWKQSKKIIEYIRFITKKAYLHRTNSRSLNIPFSQPFQRLPQVLLSLSANPFLDTASSWFYLREREDEITQVWSELLDLGFSDFNLFLHSKTSIFFFSSSISSLIFSISGGRCYSFLL